MKKQLLKTMLLLFALIAGSSSAWAADVLHYTLDGTIAGGNSNYAQDGGGLTQGGIEWSVIGNTTTTPWRIGGKSITKTDRVAYSKTAMDAAITKIELEIGDINLEAVNSIKLIVASDADFTLTLDEITKTEITANTTLTFAPTSPATEWATDAYYKFIFNVTQSTNSNKYLQFKSAKFYKSGAAVSVTGVTVDPTEWTMEVGETKELTATVAPAEATNKNVTWSSNKESVATVSDAGVVTAVAAGTATITVTTTDGSKTATCVITVKPAAPAVVTLDFTTNGWGFPTEKAEGPVTYTNQGYSIILQGSSGQGYYFDETNNNLLLGKTGATLTLPAFGFNVNKIKVYGTDAASGSVKFNIYVGDDAVSTEVTSSKITQEFAINAEKRTIGTVYVIKVTNNNNMRITKIEVFGNGCEAGVVTNAGWASYVTTKAMRFVEGEAFAVTAAGSGSVTLTEVTDVPNNFPVLLKGEGAKTAMVLEESPAAPANELRISTGGEINGYVLANKDAGVGFYKWAGGSLTSGKVYLPASAVAGAPEFLGFEGETTSISTTNFTNDTNNSGEFYNLAGQRVAQPTKGLYIVNGKKVIIK